MNDLRMTSGMKSRIREGKVVLKEEYDDKILFWEYSN